MRLALAAICLVMAGCASDQYVGINGDRVAPPGGYQAYCARNPYNLECGGNK